MLGRSRSWGHCCAAILAALALALVGAGHRAASPGADPLAAYAIPGGPVPTLCLGADDGDAPMADARCIACLIGHAALLAATAALARAAGWTSEVAATADAAPVAPHPGRASPVRGPPQSRLL